MDCVLSYHLNPLTCGVAKFNLTLAQYLGVPMWGLFDAPARNCSRPLLSLKIVEFSDADIVALDGLLDEMAARKQAFCLFLHAFSGTEIETRMLREAEVVYCGNSELIARLHDLRPELIEVWCPGTLIDVQRFHDAEVSVFSFGMAHKVRTDYYHDLRRLLEQTGKSYRIYLSTALHEGTSFDDSFAGAFNEMREIFGDKIYFLGYLSDTALYNYLSESTFFAAFFDKGVRANNTSVNIAMQCGSVVITNLDTYSPPAFVHGDNILDICRCDTLPTGNEALLHAIRSRAKITATRVLGWEGLVARLSEGTAPKQIESVPEAI